jgi:hypothetical protein
MAAPSTRYRRKPSRYLLLSRHLPVFLIIAATISTFGSFATVSALASLLPVQTRTATLIPWTTSDTSSPTSIIGRAREERDPNKETYTVAIAWEEEDEEVVIQLPYLLDKDADSLGSTLWPPAFAGAILGRSPAMRKFVAEKQILELGAGLGLTGWTLAQSGAASCRLTDNDDEIVKLLQTLADENVDCTNVEASVLEWRSDDDDATQPSDKADLIFGTDIAYYYFLLRPLMDTVRKFQRDDNSSAVCFIGQANRESQWELYNNMKDGCYNQLTDEHEKPWSGSTTMLLYKLQMQEWHDVGGEEGVVGNAVEAVEGVIPIAALIHEVEGNELSPLTSHDYIATSMEEVSSSSQR